MANTPTEYCIKYRKTNQSNTITDPNGYVFIRRGEFAVSGDTGVVMGKITRIVFRHTHTSTKEPWWSLYGRMYFGDGSGVDSGVIGMGFQSNALTWWNTFSENLPTPEKYATWTAIQVRPASIPARGNLYWRATRDYPMEIYVYFWAASDLVDGAEPPTVTGIAVKDSTGIGDRLGGILQGASRLAITGEYQLDPDYRYLTAQHRLTLTDENGLSLYDVAQDEDAVFDVGTISVSGDVGWVYTVTDSAGNVVSTSGTIEVLPYAAPAVSALSVQRYAETTDDQGDPVYTASDDGERVWFNFTAAVTPVNDLNAWTLKLRWGQAGEDDEPSSVSASGAATFPQGKALGGMLPSGGSERVIASGTDGDTVMYSGDRTILPDAVSASATWWFAVILEDSVGRSWMIAYANAATAYFNVEKDGVAVGMRSSARDGERLFEVDAGYESRFHGGIRGVTDYSLDEVPTGGRWIDGKPLYRRTLEIVVTAAGVNVMSDVLEDLDLVLDYSGVMVSSNGSQRPINWWYSNSLYVGVYRYVSDNMIAVKAGETGTAYVTILYTKTTDAARTIWVLSAVDGNVILAQQSAGLFTYEYDADSAEVTVTRMAELSWTAEDGNVVIG